MILTMKRHAVRHDSGLHQVKIRIPADVVERARGHVLTVTLPASAAEPECVVSYKLGEFCKGSLRTRDARTADLRRHAVVAALAGLCDAIRRGPAVLSQRQIVALSGETYRLLMAEHGDNPGSETEWAQFKALTRAALEGRIPGAPAIPERGRSDDAVITELLFGAEGELTDRVNALPVTEDMRALEQRVGRLAYWVLARHGIEVEDAQRLALLREIARAALDAGWALKRAAGGDFAPDPKAQRFPAFETRAAGVSLSDLFDRWQKETKPAGSTVTTWRGIVRDLAKACGHEDAARITAEDIVRFKDSRVALGRTAKTINDSDLACLRALFRYGLANKLITANPAEGVKVSAKKRAGTGKLPYEDAEIARLLALCAREEHPARRWIPLLLATSGARVGEVSQLWAERVREIDGVPCMELRPAEDGGSFKTEGSERIVPLHPAVIEAGFLRFVDGKGRGPLFYGRSRGKGSARHVSKGVGNHLADWIRTQGFDNPRKPPSHALRHAFKSAAVRVGMLDSVADAIQGHAPKTEAGTYRHFDMKTLAKAVASIPIPILRDADGGMPAEPVPRTEERRSRP